MSRIHMHFNYATKALTVIVYAEFEPTQVETVNISEAERDLVKEAGPYSIMKGLIARGLRGQLEMQSIVTGQLQIVLDFYPDKPAIYTGIDKTIQEIPTIPTPFQELAKKLKAFPLRTS